MECECPFCGRVTKHLVRSDDLKRYAWCQVCFRVHVLDDDHAVHVHFDVSQVDEVLSHMFSRHSTASVP